MSEDGQELDYDNPAMPPSGTYIVVSDDSNYHSWIDNVHLGNSHYCPGMRLGCCSLGGYGERVEQLHVGLCILQEAHN
jgi:hypothetical protein